MQSDRSSRRSDQPTVEWDDLIWLKASVPNNDFVSAGVLFFRGKYDLEDIRSQIGRALKDYPKLLSVPAIARDGAWRWETTRGFDPLANVSVRSIPASVREAAGRIEMDTHLAQALHEIVSAGLPHDRPLWRIVIVTDLRYASEEAFCLIFSTHHSVADGVAYYDMLANICQHPDRGQHHVREARIDRSTWSRRLLGRVRYLLGMLVSEPGTALLRGQPGGMALAISAAHPTAALARLAKQAGVSLNAIAMAVLARSLGSYAAERSGRTPRWIRAVLPVSMHTRDENTRELINKMGYCHVKMALREPDLVALARSIDAQLRSSKAFSIDTILRQAARFLTFLPTTFTRMGHRFFSSRSSLVVSCFPFPSGALRLGGAEAVNIGAFPVIPMPLSLSAMIVTHARALTLYMRSNRVHHDVVGIVTRFGEVIRGLEDRPGERPALAERTGREEERACSA